VHEDAGLRPRVYEKLWSQIGFQLFQDDSLTFLDLEHAIGFRLRLRVSETDLFASLDVVGDLSRFHGVTSV
jgi:hypothetical protein